MPSVKRVIVRNQGKKPPKFTVTVFYRDKTGRGAYEFDIHSGAELFERMAEMEALRDGLEPPDGH